MNSEAGTFQPDPSVAVSERGRVVRCVIQGQPVYFTITKKRDVIQMEHRQGRFYETEELELIRQHFRPGSVFCDIGANIGNHTLFALLFLQASRAILFEPNPVAVAILYSNINMNGLADRCDTSHLGLGLSDKAADGLSIVAPLKNLGGGRIVEANSADQGGLRVRRGDDLLAGTQVDFIKIDVEGMEMRVLSGLSEVIARCQPTMFVEVDSENADDFAAWVDANSYAVLATYRRYDVNENFLIAPVRSAANGL